MDLVSLVLGSFPNSMDPFFSIVIPTYNRATLIGKTLESILAQTYPHYEVLIIDDGSTDDTASQVKEYLSDRIRYYKKEHEERSSARNFGTGLAKGDYINWFDSDDLMLPGHLEELARIVREEKKPALIGVAYEVEQPGKGVVFTQRFPARVINRYLLRNNFMLTMTGIARRDIADRFPFNTHCNWREDYELWLRIASDHDIVCSNAVTVRVIEHDQSTSVLLAKNGHAYMQALNNFIKEAGSNKSICRFMNGKMSVFKMYNYAGAAYFLATRGFKAVPVRLLIRSIRNNPLILLRKEFYSSIKQIIFSGKKN